MEKHRILRLRTLARRGGGEAAGDQLFGAGGRYRFGSGYLVAPELVLTAAHVVVPGEPCQVRALVPDRAGAAAAADWSEGTVVAVDPGLDLAVVAVPGLGVDVAPVPWGRLTGTDVVEWRATGFPIAGLDEVDRQPEELSGTVAGLTQEPAGRLGLTVLSRPALGDGWAGLSGAGLFVGDWLVGVVVSVPDAFARSLTAVRVTAVAGSPELAEALGHPEPEPVTVAPGTHRQHAIEGFLAALRQRSEELPYTAIQQFAERGDRRVPLLSQIYIEQQQESPPDQQPPPALTDEPMVVGPPRPGAAPLPPVSDTWVRETAEEALARHTHLLVDGRAGIGKSTLLHHLATSADSLERRAAAAAGGAGGAGIARSGPGRPGGDLGVPVRVTARQLVLANAGSFAGSLRQAVAEEMGLDLPYELPDDVFARPPAPGRRWLVLVDALDEVVDTTARKRLLDSLKLAVRRPLYRLVVTSRPATDLAEFAGKAFGHYRLLPFERDQMQAFVEGWFAARSEEPEADAEAFLQQVDGSRISELAATPLLLTMAALLSEQPDRQGLPPSRAHLYRDFVTMLLDEESSRETRKAFVAEWERRHGDDGRRAADRLFDGRWDLLVELARWQFDDQLVHDSTRFVTRHADALLRAGLVPDRAGHAWLCDQLETLLGRTGVVGHRAGDLSFIHETFREFFVATTLTEADGPDSRAARDLVRQWEYGAMREIVLFAIALWSLGSTGGDATRLLQHIWRPGGRTVDSEAVLTVANALSEGIRADPGYEEALASALVDLALQPYTSDAGWAITALGRLGRTGELVRLAGGDEPGSRVPAIVALLELGALDAARRALVEVAGSGATDAAEAAELFAERVDVEEGRRLLHEIVTTDAHDSSLSTAATALARAGVPDATLVVLRAQADDPRLAARRRVAAARLHTALEAARAERAAGGEPDDETSLVGVGSLWGTGRFDRRALVVRTITAIAADPTAEPPDRYDAAAALAELGHVERGRAVLVAVLRDASASDHLRGRAARRLLDADEAGRQLVLPGVLPADEVVTDEEARRAVLDLLAEPAVSLRERLDLAVRLAWRGDAPDEVVALLRRLARPRRRWSPIARLRGEREIDRSDRFRAARALVDCLGDDEPLRRVVLRRRDRVRRSALRHSDVEEAVAAIGGPAALRHLARSRRAGAGTRRRAAVLLAVRGDRDVLTRMATGATGPGERRAAATELARLGDLGPLRRLAEEPSAERDEALHSLAALGDVDHVRSLAEAAAPDDWRLRFTLTTALSGHVPRADTVAAYRAIGLAAGAPFRTRQFAAQRLDDMGAEGATEAYLAIAHDPAVPPDARLDAARRGPGILADEVLAVARAVLADPDAEPDTRYDAVAALEDRGAVDEAVAHLSAVGHDPGTGPGERLRAARVLGRLEQDERAAAIALAVATDRTVAPSSRTEAATLASDLGRTAAALPVLKAIVDDGGLGISERLAAAGGLVDVGALDDLVGMLRQPREVLVERRLRDAMHRRLQDTARVTAVGSRRAARALGSVPRPGKAALAGEAGYLALRLLFCGVLTWVAALVAVAAVDRTGLFLPAEEGVVVGLLTARWTASYVRRAYQADWEGPADRFLRAVVRGPFDLYRMPALRWRLAWPVGVLYALVVASLLATVVDFVTPLPPAPVLYAVLAAGFVRIGRLTDFVF